MPLKSMIAITQTSRVLAGTRVYTPVVHYEGRSLACDGNLPHSLMLLVPHGWGNAANQTWVPFVERAILLGRL